MTGPSDIGGFIIGASPIGGVTAKGEAIFQACLAAVLGDTPEGPTWPTIAETRVYVPRDWPVTDGDIPILKIEPPTETYESLGKAGIQFLATITVEMMGSVSAAATADNKGAALVRLALGMFQQEVIMAVVGNPTLFGGDQPSLVEQLVSVQTKQATNSDGKLQRGEFSIAFNFTYYLGTEDFQQPVLTAIDRFHLYADLINVADPTGTYAPPAGLDYTPTPAPRTAGPDGRIEGEVDVTVT